MKNLIHKNTIDFEELISRNGKLRHDLRNFLKIIEGAISIYTEDPDYEYIKMVHRAVENSETIIEEMKNLEKLLTQILSK